ncbi:ABC transporter permease [Lacrimispora sp. NSJ-141]|uniref:ABC transporter permease n=1 Tax=Lientehia hominis TaxID=2897778 RepID=A0AAP2RJI0_9FIRM|nr:ABC transporter permease [Lientehia hominis]MCD2493409.1 ABC transporter permease [Lientehia hominis]
MLGKVAFRNARRSAKDYGIYMVTVTIAFALIYAYNMLIYSDDIKELSSSMDSMTIAIIMVSAIVVLAVGWLVSYMTKFMLQKRSRELGTYMMLGISNRTIARMFLLEQVFMGVVAALCGILLGSFLYQILVSVIMNIFHSHYEIRLAFSVQALVLTGIYIALIYLFALFFTRRRLKKMKICDLLYAEKKNENTAIGKTRGHWILLIASAAVGFFGCFKLYEGFQNAEEEIGNALLIGTACLIVCLYGCYIFLSAFLSRLFLKKEKRKYKKDNMFLFRNLTAKMNTMSITLGTLAMLITLTLVASQVALLFNGFFESQAAISTGFDVLISANVEDEEKKDFDFSDYEAYLEENLGIQRKLKYSLYVSGNRTVWNWIEEHSSKLAVDWFDSDPVIAYSDYQALREIQGYEPVFLEKDSYLISSLGNISECIGSQKIPLEINGRRLSMQECRLENFAQNGINGYYYFLVVPDDVALGLAVEKKSLAVDTARETTEQDYENLDSIRSKTVKKIESIDENGEIYESEVLMRDAWIEVKGKTLNEKYSFFTVFSFALFYLSLIFSCVVATILVVQQLSEASRYKFRYRVLSNLGMTKSRMERLIFKQMVFYFGAPLILPVFLSAFITFCVNELCRMFVGMALFLPSVLGALCLFLLVYLLYFAAAYISYRKSVLE